MRRGASAQCLPPPPSTLGAASAICRSFRSMYYKATKAGSRVGRARSLFLTPSLVTRGQCFGVWMLLEAKEERPRARSCGAAVLCSQDVIVRFLRVQRSKGNALCI